MLLNICLPLLYASFFNKLILKDVHKTINALVVLALAHTVEIFLSNYLRRVDIRLAREVNLAVKRKVSDELLTIPLYMLEDYSPGKLQVILSTDTTAPSTFMSTLFSASLSLLTILGSLIAIFSIDWQLSLVLIAMYPIAFVASRCYGKRLRDSALELSRGNDDFVGYIRKIAGEQRDIRAQDSKKVVLKEYYSLARYSKEITMKHMYLKSNYSLLMAIISFLSHLVLIGFGAVLILSGRIPLGILVAFSGYSKTFSTASRSISHLRANIQPALVSIERLAEISERFSIFSDQEKDLISDLGRIVSIRFDKVSMSFGEKKVLQKFSSEFHNGITGIQGPNGCGKTTIMNLMLKNFCPSEGEILINDVSISEISYTYIQKNFSYTGSAKVLYDLTVRENLLLFNGCERVSDHEITEVLGIVHLHEDIGHLPNGIETRITTQIELSSGQIQKIQVARALLKNANVMLFDEAFSNLDVDTKHDIFSYIGSKHPNAIIIIVSHNTNDYLICNNIYTISI